MLLSRGINILNLWHRNPGISKLGGTSQDIKSGSHAWSQGTFPKLSSLLCFRKSDWGNLLLKSSFSNRRKVYTLLHNTLLQVLEYCLKGPFASLITLFTLNILAALLWMHLSKCLFKQWAYNSYNIGILPRIILWVHQVLSFGLYVCVNEAHSVFFVFLIVLNKWLRWLLSGLLSFRPVGFFFKTYGLEFLLWRNWIGSILGALGWVLWSVVAAALPRW